MGDVLRLPELIEVVEESADLRRELPALRRALAAALRAFAVQRGREGRHLARDMRARVGVVAGVARDLRRGLPAAREVVRARLEERVARLAAGIEIEPARLAHEIVGLVERGDVTEEVVRLEGHVAALRAALGEAGPVGKRIEFLLQEVQRELNTTGSKAATPGLAALALRGKEEVEKLREQVQNVE
jgi:uncharacterized protein (TIGR00255 family)